MQAVVTEKTSAQYARVHQVMILAGPSMSQKRQAGTV
jgi:hypothetical protein